VAVESYFNKPSPTLATVGFLIASSQIQNRSAINPSSPRRLGAQRKGGAENWDLLHFGFESGPKTDTGEEEIVKN